MLDDAIERSKAIYLPLGAHWQDQPKTWRFPGGGRLRFRPLERVEDADKYQGQNLSDVCIEEAGQYPDSRPIDRLHAVLRSASGVPTQLVLTGNPGGAGQGWIKARYIDPEPRGFKVLVHRIELPEWAGGGSVDRKAVFIPSRVADNRFLGRDYIAGLHLVGSGTLVRAWLEGDWDAVEGAFFDCWNTRRHVIDPIALPDHLHRFRSGDWGSAKPFSIGWWAVASDAMQAVSVTGDAVTLPRGCMIRYREWYGSSGPNVGLKLTAEEVARGIADRQKDDPSPKDILGVLDPSAFAEDGGPSIAERMGTAASIYWSRADNKRVAQAGALGGWDQMRARMKGDADGNPMVACFSTCRDSIRTIPVLQHDLTRAEDLDTESEDHAADEWRYGCMSRPWVRNSPSPDKTKFSDYKPRAGRDASNMMVL